MLNNVERKLIKKSLPTINQIVVVEGKTDTNHLKKLFNVNTIETHGSALNQRTINLINMAANTKGIILFLDPDYAGEKIRRNIISQLTSKNYCEAFITQKEWHSFKKGVNEASDNEIIKALTLATKITNNQLTDTLSWNEYISLNLNTKIKRNQLCNALHISYCNHKQLFKRLNMLNLNLKQIRKIMKYDK